MDSAEEVFEFLQANPLQYCATVGLDGKPKARPFQMMYYYCGNIYYCTGAKKAVYAELQNNPYVELSASTMDKWLRISGRVEWVEGREARESAIESLDIVKSIYKNADNTDLKVFYIAEAVATITDFSGNPPKTYKLN